MPFPPLFPPVAPPLPDGAPQHSTPLCGGGRNTRRLAVAVGALLACASLSGAGDLAQLRRDFAQPPAQARPWVFWYWMNGRVCAEGITADLEAMKQAGLGGAYLMPIKGPEDPPAYEPSATQLSPRYWRMVRHAAREAARLGLELGVHACDGFAVAGGPWITPELSMQRLVWSTTHVTGGGAVRVPLEQPPTNEGYYRDVAVLAFPRPAGWSADTTAPVAARTSDNAADALRLADGGNTERYRSAAPCWIEFEYAEPFTCRSVTVTPDGNNFQSQRLTLLTSDDGREYREAARLEPPRHGWQDEGRPVTHAIRPATARRFRFAWAPDGSEPGAEDLDAAKWAAVLKVQSIELSPAARIPNFRGKSGAVWRIGRRADDEVLPVRSCVSPSAIIDLSDRLDGAGRLAWGAPAGDWVVMRMGHTSTGRRNETAGGGKGLECDKFNPAAAQLQFDRWFGETRRQVVDELGPAAAAAVLTTFHVDSWECGSQNWTRGFCREFQQLHGYDPRPYLPCMAGVPVGSAEQSESFLRDVRATIAGLTADCFYGTLADLARRHGVRFTGECTAPTMTGDALRHFAALDAPMGEFWLDSPTHDKPTDMLDAVSAGRAYGKPVIQAEAFTQLRIAWDESPAGLKSLGDRVLALGANRMVMHVFTHNPWLDRKPGQTLGGVGSFFQRDQPWLTAARGWMGCLARSQAVLQQGDPVVDIAVWTGDDLPSRAVRPDQLAPTLPGLVGRDKIAAMEARKANLGQPQREAPHGVKASANIPDPAAWVDPLRGYQYSSVNSHALLHAARVEQGRLVFPGGMRCRVLVLPAAHSLTPNASLITPQLAETLAQFVDQGLVIVAGGPLAGSASPNADDQNSQRVQAAIARMRERPDRFIERAWSEESLSSIGVEPDLRWFDRSGRPSAGAVAWSHRREAGRHVYFVSNQSDERRVLDLSLRASGSRAEVWDPVSGVARGVAGLAQQADRTGLTLELPPSGGVFVVLHSEDSGPAPASGEPRLLPMTIESPWRVSFHSAVGQPPKAVELAELRDLSQSENPAVAHFVGAASYECAVHLPTPPVGGRVWLDLGAVAPLAEVRLNGHDCGVAWTPPWRVDVTDAIRPGENRLRVTAHSTWKNRLVREARLPSDEQQVWTSAPFRLPDNQLTPFGLMGPVRLLHESE